VDNSDKRTLWESHMWWLYYTTNPAHLVCNRSTDRGITWTNESCPDQTANGDPTNVIAKDGKWFVCFLQNSQSCEGTIRFAEYVNNSLWQAPITIAAPVPGGCKLDKPFFAVDNTVDNGINYCAWSPRACSDNIPDGCHHLAIEIARSEDKGLSWPDIDKKVISTDLYPGDPLTANNGANIQIGPDGEVYVAWVCTDLTDNSPNPFVTDEDVN
ncbi:MAG TPA: hypothetical protein PKG48_15005, partial [Bacteroidales bacterium]|nr:hypothetical protein [Bacteroidales bacterium]